MLSDNLHERRKCYGCYSCPGHGRRSARSDQETERSEEEAVESTPLPPPRLINSLKGVGCTHTLFLRGILPHCPKGIDICGEMWYDYRIKTHPDNQTKVNWRGRYLIKEVVDMRQRMPISHQKSKMCDVIATDQDGPAIGAP